MFTYKRTSKQYPVTNVLRFYCMLFVTSILASQMHLAFSSWIPTNYVKDGWNCPLGLECGVQPISELWSPICPEFSPGTSWLLPSPSQPFRDPPLCSIVLFSSQCCGTVHSQAHISPCRLRSLWQEGPCVVQRFVKWNIPEHPFPHQSFTTFFSVWSLFSFYSLTVFDILSAYFETQNWPEALKKGVSSRKGYVLQNSVEWWTDSLRSCMGGEVAEGVLTEKRSRGWQWHTLAFTWHPGSSLE